MKYECSYKRGIYPKGSQAVIFERMTEAVGLDKDENKIFFGVFDSGSENVARSMPGETTESLDTFIQALPDFKERKPGVFGIWPESERLGKIIVGHEKDGVKKFLADMGEKFLRTVLAEAKVTVPLSATKDELVILAAGLSEKQVGFDDTAKSVPPPVATVEGMGALEKPKPAKK